MTPEEINKKAYERYPVKMDVEYDSLGNAEDVDLNARRRQGYIEAYKEISSLPTIKGWVARDEKGDVYLYPYYRPTRDKGCWFGMTGVFLKGDPFPSLSWEDEPIEVGLPIIQK